jgi:alpha-galactosidase
MKEQPPAITPNKLSEEHGSYIIEALEAGRVYRGHFNVINQNHITNLPNGCVIEIPGYVDQHGINMPVVGELPLVCAATCAASVRVQEMGMEAAVHRDVMLLRRAMLHDSLVGAVCNPEEVWQVTDEMPLAQAKWLPQYVAEIPGAQRRLEEAEMNGTRVKLRKTRGAARLHIMSVGEMMHTWDKARTNAVAADKRKMAASDSSTTKSLLCMRNSQVFSHTKPFTLRTDTFLSTSNILFSPFQCQHVHMGKYHI